MKKILSFLSIAVAAFALHSCEDVPAPYEYPTAADKETSNREVLTAINGYFAFEDFSDGTLGDFYTANTVGDYPWQAENKSGSYYAKASSFEDVDGDGESDNNKAESWLLSKPCDFSNVKGAYVSFDYILRYATASQISTHYQLRISKDYVKDGDINAATWETLPLSLVQGSDWTTWYTSGKIVVPDTYIGESRVTIGLFYKSSTKAATWEVKNLTIAEGEGSGDKEDEGEQDGVKKLPYTEAFSTTLGAFKNYTTSGKGAWTIDYSTAKAAGYDNATQVTTAGTYYLVSPEISLAEVKAAHLSFDYIFRYNRGDENQQLFISESFNAEKPTEGWTALSLTLKEGSDWTTFYKADIQIPEAYLGKTVRIAFYYNTNATNGSTWEVKNFALQEGNVGESGGDGGGTDTPDNPVTGGSLVVNGDFEGWTDGKPNHWKTATTAGNATLSQSTVARSGSYSVCVTGSSTSNKRIGYEEMVLKAGTYKMQFYVRAATAEGGSVRPGYATFNADGSINSSGYKYGDYANDLLNSEWREVNHEFTLDKEQKVAFVVMNSKNPGKDVLIDDFSVTTTNGGVADGGGSTETPDTPDTPVTEGYFSESFASSLGAFTIENKTMPSDLSYIWNHATYNSEGYAKASAYKGQAYAAEGWLISPSIDLTKASSATLTFAHTGKFFGTPEQEAFVMVKAEGGSWTELTISDWFTNSDYTFVDASINLNAYAGKKIQIAFVYKSTASAAGTWEVKNVVIK